jgi:hypothetical protein
MRASGKKLLSVTMLGLFLIGMGCTMEKAGEGDQPAAVQPSGEMPKEPTAPAAEPEAPAEAPEAPEQPAEE